MTKRSCGAAHRALSLLLVLSALTACVPRGLAFQQDRRLVITAPRYREKVSLPVTVTWRVDDPEALRRAGVARFGVYLDTAPQPPGEPLAWFAREDELCEPAQGCPDATYLAQRRIFTTNENAITFATMATAPGADLQRGDRDLHDVTVVLLDARDRRIGEAAWTITFETAAMTGEVAHVG